MLKADTKELSYFISKRGFSKRSLSKAIGIDRNTLALYLSEPERMTIQMVNQIAAALDLNTEEFRHIFFCT